MNKKIDSVRSLGQASIGTDKPTRDRLKAAADAAGMPLSEYLRRIADEVTSNKQGVLSPSFASLEEKADPSASFTRNVMAVVLEGLAHFIDRNDDYEFRPWVYRAIEALSGGEVKARENVEEAVKGLRGLLDDEKQGRFHDA